MVLSSSSATDQFIAGSLDNPVSTAWIWGAISRKHSSKRSNPDLEPYIPYQGVQTWAGMTIHWGLVSRTSAVVSRTDKARVGRPSGSRLPWRESLLLSLATVSKSGANNSR